jgi:isopenicillin N synthase-like dioxygenase
MFTLLTTDDVPGLQILPRGGSEWIDVPPRAGAFVVNIGDLLQRWSNDVFKSTVHRVVNHEARERFSMPFFFEPNFDCVGACAPVALVQFSLSLSLSLSLYLVSLCFCSLLF